MASFQGGSEPQFNVRGGRLGRDHTFEDVPVHFVRDCLMEAIDTTPELPEDKKDAARRAICPDLTDDQLAEYADFIAQRRLDEEAAEEAELKAAQAKSDRAQIQANSLLLLEDALDSVDTDIDLTPLPLPCAKRNPNLPKAISSSVVCPARIPMPEELKIVYQFSIDHDCDQIRAMIKIFLSEGQWTLDEFRQALRNVSRKQLTTFLNRRGSAGPQLRSAAYQLSWEFFNWRKYLGLPLEGANIHDDVCTVEGLERERQRQERQLELQLKRQERERSQKRARVGADGDSGSGKAKRQKKARREPLKEIVNEAE